MRRTLIIASTLVALVQLARAQAPSPPPALPVNGPPAVGELTKARAEIADLAQKLAVAAAERDLCRGQLAPASLQQNLREVNAERQKIVEAFEKENPGWTLDPRTLAVTKKPEKK
jgi:sirohydrochlorin ferrochelatase